MESFEPRDWLLLGALLVGLTFGVIGRLSGFCFRAALIEVMERRPGRQLAAWIGALTAAVLGTQALSLAGLIDLSQSIYLSQSLTLGGLALGGLVFGFGMILTRGCGARHLVLAAGGNLRSLIVLVSLGLSAYATLRGILALPRTWITQVANISIESPDQSLVTLVGANLGLDAKVLLIIVLVAAVMAAGLVVLRTSWQVPILASLAAGVLIGLLVPAGWYVTGVLGFDEFEPGRLESLTFTAPVGNALQYLLTYTGASADFGITAVGGVLLGALATALATRRIRIEAFDAAGPLARYLLGGAMMGFGGVLALGCTVGAGLSGLSTLSLGSLVATCGIISGGLLALSLAREQAPEVGARLSPAPTRLASVLDSFEQEPLRRQNEF